MENLKSSASGPNLKILGHVFIVFLSSPYNYAPLRVRAGVLDLPAPVILIF